MGAREGAGRGGRESVPHESLDFILGLGDPPEGFVGTVVNG